MALDICGFAVMGNHLHVVVRTRPVLVAGWSDEEVARRWWRLFPKRRDEQGQAAEPEEQELGMLLAGAEVLAERRRRLSSLSWFMRCLSEPIARRASNKGFLSMELDDYLRILDWTGRQVRRGKRGAIPKELAPLLERLGMSVEFWLETATNFGRWFHRAAGRVSLLAEEAGPRRQTLVPGRGLLSASLRVVRRAKPPPAKGNAFRARGLSGPHAVPRRRTPFSVMPS